jgi:hypothetical protein
VIADSPPIPLVLPVECHRQSGIVSLSASVSFSVATRTQRNQVVHHITAELAPGFQMMDLQVPRDTAVLAAPIISRQHPVTDHHIIFRRELEPGLLLA